MVIGRRVRVVAAIAVVAMVVLAGTAALLALNSTSKGSEKLSIVTSFYPLYYFSSEIGKDLVDVSMLIPDNSEPHTWEPSPSDIINLNQADVLVYNGQGFEPWIDTLLSSIDNKDLTLVDTSQNVSALLSDEVLEAYDAAVKALNAGSSSTVAAAATEGTAEIVTTEGYVQVDLPSMGDGNGGYLKMRSATGGDMRFFTTDGKLSILTSDGTELEYEMDNGPVNDFPMFNSSKFVELEANATYTLHLNSTSSSIGLVMLAGEGEEEHEHGLNDPHFWLDPLSAKTQVVNIRNALMSADPDNRTAYQENADDLLSRLDALDQEFVDGLAHRTKNAIITTHEGFDYLARRYGFEAYAAIGISADAQPSAADLAALADKVKELGLHYVFSEPIFSDSVMQTIAQETGAQVLVLDGVHGRTGVHASMDYFQIMRANLGSLKIGLEVAS